ncbi:Ppx/GppA family phosphatase [Proteiniclasticum sp. BAD-10]|uniref:Ppx/GppA family phosphatase n=1 Tax=Proteiniclasticum sediminis TaxID=2804028 RepID=A0A941CP08_9CLOT|nr:Ppx/GppA family phosphatase [Proteiniclasticum sediminis]MBR0574758.1 Ppx/GppA family phosphatase [Proteiniclasticum sediminis]
MRVGIIDIGSNSMRLVIYEVQGKSYFVVGQVRHSARLGQNMVHGSLHRGRIEYGIKVLKDFKEYMESKNVTEVIAVATEAVRKAANKDEFLSRAKAALGNEIRVLSGEEEAFYDYYATVNTLDLEKCLMVDIGGSSTEIVLIENRVLQEAISIPFGSIVLTEQFNIKENPSQEEALISYLKDNFKAIPWLKRARNYPVVGIGGSVRTLGKIDRFRKDNAMFISHNYSMDQKDVSEIYDLIREYLEGTVKRVNGLSRDREDIFIGSLATLNTLMRHLNSRKLFISNAGIRDGLLFERILGRNRRIPDVLEFSLDNIITNHMYQGYEGKDLFQLVRVMYTALCKSFPQLLGNGKVLKCATYLYDIGTNINYFQRDRNTFYSILNAPINGLSQKQILMAASSASVFSANDLLKEFFHKKILSTRDMRIIEMLGILIKIAEALNHGVSGATEIVSITLTDTGMLMECKTPSDPIFKMEELKGYLPKFRSIFKLTLDVRFLP